MADQPTPLEIAWTWRVKFAAAGRRLQESYRNWRDRALWLALAGAGMSAFSAVIAANAAEGSNDARTASALALIAAALLAGASIILKRAIGDSGGHDWLRARAAAEQLKSEAFRYRAGGGGYLDGDRAERLLDKTAEICAAFPESQRDAAGEKPPADVPDDRMSREDYVRERAYDQVAYYRKAATAADNELSRYRWCETIMLAAAAFLSAIAALNPATISVWVAVATTAAAGFAARITAERHDFRATTFIATAQALEFLCAKRAILLNGGGVETPEDFAKFVDACEDIMQREHGGWFTEMSEAVRQAAAEISKRIADADKKDDAAS